MGNASGQIKDTSSFSDRRVYSRQPLRSLSYVELDEGNGGIVLNIGEGGLSVQAVMSLMDDSLPRMRFQLSHSKDWVEASARIAWTNDSRKVAGLQFVNLPEQARSYIREWLSREASQAEGAEQQGREELEEEEQAPGEHAGPRLPPTPRGTPLQTSEPVAARPAATVQRQLTSIASREAAAPASTSAPPELPPAPVYLFGRTFDRPASTIERSGQRFEDPSAGASRSRRLWVFAGLAIVLAVVSLAAGWAAGRGTLNSLLERIRGIPPAQSVEQDVATSLSGPAAQISEIEVVDINSRRWTIPLEPPASVPDGNTRRQPPQIHDWSTFGASPSAAETRTQHPTDGTDQEKATPPIVSAPTGGSGSILPSPGSTDLRSLVPAPPNAELPTQPQTGILQRGTLIYHADPIYPEIARQQKVEGTVKLRVTIGADGTIRSVMVISGPELLVDAARSAVRQWRYTPTLLDGKPVESEEYVSIVFQLPPASK